MSTTMVASEVKPGRPVASSIQDIPLERIRESGRNPRRVFDEARLQELATNIRSHGVLQAILVHRRPLPESLGNCRPKGKLKKPSGDLRREHVISEKPPAHNCADRRYKGPARLSFARRRSEEQERPSCLASI